MKKVEIGGIYEHHKGTRVKVVGECFHSETMEPMVVYIHLEDGGTWVRSKEMFLESVIINGNKVERFKKIKSEIKIKTRK